MDSDENLYHELSFCTLAHPDPAFIHQHIVDAYTAQHANDTSKPIALVFALIGLYLYIEKGFTGKHVQKVHMQLARFRKPWVRPELPGRRGEIKVRDVLAASPGPSRDGMIHTWCESVWEAWNESREQVMSLLKEELNIT
jgi:hypothetical protein